MLGALLNRARERLIDVRLDMAAERIEIALPKGFEDHPVSGFGALEEPRNVKAGIGCEDRADPWPGGRHVSQLAAFRRRRLGRDRLSDLWRGARIRVCRFED